eukprot:TRINITY_DN2483_c0_g1_i1.p1 TRINITY_DN2483_c0_g1~~TRINITY_DN2483_c0_g1_i1.p1  ORF type:complete len:897 (+),score=180.27 TRINITY_DN2483_c0_g1_i1:37-2727(+)
MNDPLSEISTLFLHVDSRLSKWQCATCRKDDEQCKLIKRYVDQIRFKVEKTIKSIQVEKEMLISENNNLKDKFRFVNHLYERKGPNFKMPDSLLEVSQNTSVQVPKVVTPVLGEIKQISDDGETSRDRRGDEEILNSNLKDTTVSLNVAALVSPRPIIEERERNHLGMVIRRSVTDKNLAFTKEPPKQVVQSQSQGSLVVLPPGPKISLSMSQQVPTNRSLHTDLSTNSSSSSSSNWEFGRQRRQNVAQQDKVSLTQSNYNYLKRSDDTAVYVESNRSSPNKIKQPPEISHDTNPSSSDSLLELLKEPEPTLRHGGSPEIKQRQRGKNAITRSPTVREDKSESRQKAERQEKLQQISERQEKMLTTSQQQESKLKSSQQVVLPEKKTAEYGDESINAKIRRETVKVEFQRLRDKLSKNYEGSIQNEYEQKIFRLQTRLNKLNVEMSVLQKSFSRMRDFRNRIENDLFLAGSGPRGLSVLSIKDGTLSTRSTGVTKMWRKRRVILTENSLYVFREINVVNSLNEVMFELVFKVGLNQDIKVEEKEDRVFLLNVANGKREIEFQTELDSEKGEWLKLIHNSSYQLQNPLAKFGLSNPQTMIPRLCLSEYRFALAIIEHSCQKENYEHVIILVLEAIESLGKELYEFIAFITREDIHATNKIQNLFRQNTHAAKTLGVYCQMIGIKYLQTVLQQPLNNLISQNLSMEIFDTNLDSNQMEQNYKNIEYAFQLIFDAIVNSAKLIPWQLKYMMNIILESVFSRFPEAIASSPNETKWISVGGFFFLRFVCPNIVVPERNKILSSAPPKDVRRGLLFITKILQAMSNNVLFGSKEPQMIKFNALIDKNRNRLGKFLAELTEVVEIPSNLTPKPLSDVAYYALKTEIINILDKIEPILYATCV